jgi:RNA polymerase sigma-70 factor (ECF subfamily)
LKEDRDFAFLIKECIKDDPEAKKVLYYRFAPQFMGLCCRYAKSKMDAQDILQEGFIKVFENLKSLKNIESLEGWMKKIFVNEALKFIEKDKRLMSVDISNASKITSVAASILDQFSTDDITKIIQGLPDKMRIVFNMYAIEGYSHQEIAKELNIAIGTSKSNLHDARKQIKRNLSLINCIKKESTNG